jgi:hypothetical protein
MAVAITASPDGQSEMGATALSSSLRGAAEALSVLSARGATDRQRAVAYSMNLLSAMAGPVDWLSVGLPQATEAPPELKPRLRITDPAVLRLAREAMSLYCSMLSKTEQARASTRLAAFFAEHVPPEDEQLARMRQSSLIARADAGDVTADVIDGMRETLNRRVAIYGDEAYITGVARTSLAAAYRNRGTEADYAEAVRLCTQEALTSTARYGATHPVTLVAYSILTSALLAQAEATTDKEDRVGLAQRALSVIKDVRIARDELYGINSPNVIISRRYQGHALLLADELTRARSCLQYCVAFENARNDNREWRGSGVTHFLLARVNAGLGDDTAALDHAGRAIRLLAADNPLTSLYQSAAELLKQLTRRAADLARVQDTTPDQR